MLTAAAALLVVLALLHSVLGELFILRHLSQTLGMPILKFPPLLGRDTAAPTLRACWHVLTVFGLAMAYLLYRLGSAAELGGRERAFLWVFAVTLAACAAVMAAGTRGKHLGWLGFLVAAALTWAGAR